MSFRKLADTEWQERKVKIAEAKKAEEERQKAMTPPVKPTPQDQWEVGSVPGEIRLKKGCTNEQFAAACKANVGWIKSITFAFGGNKAITSLAPITEVKGLQKLSIWIKNDQQHPLDLGPLAGMTELQELDCEGCMTNGKALSGLKKLKKLNFKGFGVSIDEIQFVKDLPELEELAVPQTEKPVTDISPLLGAKKLKKVSLGCVYGLTDEQLAPISSLTDLEEITISGKIKSLSFLKGCTKLKVVNASGEGFMSEFSDISALKDMKNLANVKLFGPKITDLSALAGKAELSSLDIAFCTVSDLSPLKNCDKLKSLGIISTKVTDLSVLAGITELSRIDAQNTEIKDLSPLKKCVNLEDLLLSNSKVSDLLPLAGCAKLRQLLCGRTAVTDISALKSCKALKYLTVPKTVPQAQVDELKTALPQARIDVQ